MYNIGSNGKMISKESAKMLVPHWSQVGLIAAIFYFLS